MAGKRTVSAQAPEHAPEHDDEEQLGLAAAGRYLVLAWRALLTPLQQRAKDKLPSMPTATRVYLLYNIVIYGIAAAAFLTNWPAFHVGRTGLGSVDAPLFHTLWGLTALVVCLLQIVVQLTPRWFTWEVCAVGTAMWATAWGWETLLMAHAIGQYGGVLLWGFLIGMHFLFISNHLVPIHTLQRQAPSQPSTAAGAAQKHVETDEEQGLVARLEEIIREPLELQRVYRSARSPRPRARRAAARPVAG